MGSETEYGAIALDEPPPISLGTLIAFLKIRKRRAVFRRRPDGFDRWTRREPHQFPESVKRLFSFLENKRAERKLMAWEGVSARRQVSLRTGRDDSRRREGVSGFESSGIFLSECADPYQLIGCERNFPRQLRSGQAFSGRNREKDFLFPQQQRREGKQLLSSPEFLRFPRTF